MKKNFSNISGGFEPVNPHLKYGPVCMQCFRESTISSQLHAMGQICSMKVISTLIYILLSYTGTATVLRLVIWQNVSVLPGNYCKVSMIHNFC